MYRDVDHRTLRADLPKWLKIPSTVILALLALAILFFACGGTNLLPS